MGLQQLGDILKVLCRQDTFYRTSIARIQVVNLIYDFSGQETFYRSSSDSRPSIGSLQIGYLLQVSYRQETCYETSLYEEGDRSYMERRPSMGFLKIEDLFKVLYGQETFYRSSIGRTPSIVLLYRRGLLQDFLNI